MACFQKANGPQRRVWSNGLEESYFLGIGATEADASKSPFGEELEAVFRYKIKIELAKPKKGGK